MADIRTLSYEDEGLDALRSELRYTERRLTSRAETAALAAPFQALIARWAGIRDQQLALWDAEDDADVAVGNLDDDADDLVPPVSHALLHVLGSTSHPQYERVFGKDTPSTIQGLGLESQIARMADWPASLRTISPETAPLGERVQGILTAGRVALDGRVASAAARADYRVGAIRGLFEEANAARLIAYGQLLGLAASTGKPKTWATRFFRKSKKTKKAAAEAV
jgi:hypothetical protein